MMDLLRQVGRKMVPKKSTVDRISRWAAFHWSMHRLMSTNPDKDISTLVFSLLVYGWGNSSYSAGPPYLQACIRAVRNTQGAILECGSGLSTVVLGWATSRIDRPVYAFEHKTEWADRVRSCLSKYGLQHVTVVNSSLRNYGSFCWYDPSSFNLPNSFSMVVCDGPPGDTKGGRYGLVPIMKKKTSQRRSYTYG